MARTAQDTVWSSRLTGGGCDEHRMSADITDEPLTRLYECSCGWTQTGHWYETVKAANGHLMASDTYCWGCDRKHIQMRVVHRLDCPNWVTPQPITVSEL